MNKKILQLAIPSIVSNITVPLLGLIDVAIVGHLGSAAYIGAIAVGGMLFNIIYWLFGFLRMGTSGMTSQAFGQRDLKEVTRVLLRAVGVGLFIGMQNSRFPMFIAITQNVVNIVASLSFVYLLDMKIEGVALGTLIAQYAGLFMASLLWLRYYGRLKIAFRWREIIGKTAMKRFFQVNSDIFFRTLCLVAVTTFFTSTGARQGDVVLAVNTLLMQLFTLFSYIMDGFAYAGEAMTGRYVGARNNTGLQRMIRLLFRWGWGLSLSFTILYMIGGQDFLGLLTNDTTVINAAGSYYYWVLAIPLAGFAAFLWDGILIGATATRLMLYSMLVASGLFFVVYYLFYGVMGNHALWMAFLIYLSLRGIMQWILWHSSHR